MYTFWFGTCAGFSSCTSFHCCSKCNINRSIFGIKWQTFLKIRQKIIIRRFSSPNWYRMKKRTVQYSIALWHSLLLLYFIKCEWKSFENVYWTVFMCTNLIKKGEKFDRRQSIHISDAEKHFFSFKRNESLFLPIPSYIARVVNRICVRIIATIQWRHRNYTETIRNKRNMIFCEIDNVLSLFFEFKKLKGSFVTIFLKMIFLYALSIVRKL